MGGSSTKNNNNNTINKLNFYSLGRLRFEVGNLVLKAVSVFSDRKPQLVFLINNYDTVVSTLSVTSSFPFFLPPPFYGIKG